MKSQQTLLQAFLDWRRDDANGEDDPSATAPISLLREVLDRPSARVKLFDAVRYAESQDLVLPPRGGERVMLTRYLKVGVPAGHDPNEWFSEAFYRSTYPDVRLGIAAGAWRCGFQHFVLRGIAEQRSPSSSFNEFGYLGSNPDVLTCVSTGAIPNGLFHFLEYGRDEDRGHDPHRLAPLLDLPISTKHAPPAGTSTFAENLYLSTHSDVLPDGQPDRGLRHWISDGHREDLLGHRRRIPGWVENTYRARNGDLADHLGKGDYPTGYAHFLLCGAAEKRPWAGSIEAAAERNVLRAALRTRSALPASFEGHDLPVISIIVPVYNPDPAAFRECIASVVEQTYPHWQLCLADDASTLPHVIETMREAARSDDRVMAVFCPNNAGISAASNAALKVASGEFLALLDHDDVLAPDALLHLAQAFLSGPDVDMVYTDEAKLGEDGIPVGLNRKPGWSPDLLLSTMYTGHLSAYRRSVVEAVGGFRSLFDGTQDYDLALRMSEVVRRVAHVAKPLYFWRMSPASTAGSLAAKPGVLAKQARALEGAMHRRGATATVSPGHAPGYWSVTLDPPSDLPLVSVVIPSAGPNVSLDGRQVDLLANNLRALHEIETYPNWEVLIVHNRDFRAETYALLANFPRVRLIRTHEAPFNFSSTVNLGVREAAGEYVLLLNDDMQAESSDIIGSMFSRFYEGVGVIGGRMLFANGSLQHAGIVGAAEGPTHAMIGEHRLTPGPGDRLQQPHDVFATSGACMFFRRSVFLELGGFQPSLPVNYNDVEFCLRLRRAGMRVLFNPGVTLYHFESQSKAGTHFWELQRLLLDQGSLEDPFWNPGFSSRSPFYESVDPLIADVPSYRGWLIDRIARRQQGLTRSETTRFSFIMSVFNNRKDQLEVLEGSVLNQTYRNFEWIVADDGSSKPETLEWLERVTRHQQVRVVRLPENRGIMAGYGAAFRAADGDYVVPIDADDFVTLDCLHVLATAIEKFGAPDVVYSDEDKGTENGEVHSPFMKPDWDPVLLSNVCYVCHICAVKRGTADAVGAYTDMSATWCHDWDTLLRVKRAGGRIEHVPEVLYSWRIHQGSTASIETGTKPQAKYSQRHVLEQDMRLTGTASSFELVQNELYDHDGCWRLLPLAAALPGCAIVVSLSGEPAAAAQLLSDLASLPRPPGARVIPVGPGDLASVLAVMPPETVKALWPEEAPARSLGLGEAAARCVAEKRVAAVIDGRIAGLNRAWLLEGLGMFAAAPGVALVGGQVTSAADQVVWRGGYAGFGGSIGSPDFGKPTGDGGGYYGLGWCQRLCDGVPSVTFFAAPDLLASVAADLEDGTSLRAVAGDLAVRARKEGLFVAYTPFVVTRIDERTAVWPIVRDGDEAVFEEGPKYYPPAFGTTLDSAFQIGMPT